MSEEHKLNRTATREHLESISTPESRRAGGFSACHVQGKVHDPKDCPRCNQERQDVRMSKKELDY
jgi:predicted Zn-ribbon and HTH transcriptional regulator